MKIEPTVAAIATAEAANAQPSWSVRRQARGEDHGDQREDLHRARGRRRRPTTSRVQITKPTTSAIAAQPERPRQPRGRARAPASVVLQLQERRAVQQAQAEQRHARSTGRRGSAGRRSCPVNSWLGVDRQAVQQVAEPDAEQQRDRAGCRASVHHVQRAPPARARRSCLGTRTPRRAPSAPRARAAAPGTGRRTSSRTSRGTRRTSPRRRRSATPRCRPTTARSC